MRLESSTGDPVILVNTDGDYRYLGRLVVDFDGEGLIITESVDPYVSGAYATDLQGAQLFAGAPIPEVSSITASLRSVLQERDGNIAGRTGVFLQGRRAHVRTQETNLGNLTADANLWIAQQVDPETMVSFKNAGGIRDQIGIVVQPPGTTSPEDARFLPPPANPVTGKGSGDVSQFDIEGALRFNNGLAIVPLTARQLVAIVEQSIGFEGVGEVPVGNFPQVGGMRFSFDPGAPPGQRIRSLALFDDSGAVADRVVEDGALAGNPERLIKVVTLSPNPPMGGVNAGQIGMREPAREKAWASLDRCDPARVFSSRTGPGERSMEAGNRVIVRSDAAGCTRGRGGREFGGVGAVADSAVRRGVEWLAAGPGRC